MTVKARLWLAESIMSRDSTSSLMMSNCISESSLVNKSRPKVNILICLKLNIFSNLAKNDQRIEFGTTLSRNTVTMEILIISHVLVK